VDLDLEGFESVLFGAGVLKVVSKVGNIKKGFKIIIKRS
jgi:hypothetical protein